MVESASTMVLAERTILIFRLHPLPADLRPRATLKETRTPARLRAYDRRRITSAHAACPMGWTRAASS